MAPGRRLAMDVRRPESVAVNFRTLPLRWLLLSVLTASSLTFAHCANPAGPTPPPPVDDLRVVCPVGVTVDNAPQIPLPVSYNAPTTTGGVAPIVVSCTHPSGSNFVSGTTDVQCTASDSATPQRQSSCVFSVSVKQSFATRATKFLAFGDSITAGEITDSTSAFRILEVVPEKAYPTVLRGLLAQRYPQESIIVQNAGSSGQPAACPAGSSYCGVNDISEQVVRNQPQVLLLLQGVVDLGTGDEAVIGPMVDGLKYIVRDAKRRGVEHVFLGTLLPAKSGFRSGAVLDLIIPANHEIRALAAAEGVYLVDVYAGMVGQEATLIGVDGLHPTPEGYKKIAEIFFDAIKARLETVVTTAGGPRRMLRTSATDGANVEIGSQPSRPPVRIRQRQ